MYPDYTIHNTNTSKHKEGPKGQRLSGCMPLG